MSATTINIRDVQDTFERYQMPLLEVKAKNKGQFNQTTIDNVPKVAKALHVDPECLMRWFGWSLKTQSQVKEKSTIMLKGAFSYEQILVQLRKFINQYVLCQKCTYPELNYGTKKKMIWTQCRACGHREKPIMSDRVWKLIHRIESSRDQSKKKKEKKGKKSSPADKFKSGGSGADQMDQFDFPVVDDDESEEWACDLSKEAVEARKAEAVGASILENIIQ